MVRGHVRSVSCPGARLATAPPPAGRRTPPIERFYVDRKGITLAGARVDGDARPSADDQPLYLQLSTDAVRAGRGVDAPRGAGHRVRQDEDLDDAAADVVQRADGSVHPASDEDAEAVQADVTGRDVPGGLRSRVPDLLRTRQGRDVRRGMRRQER